MNPRVVSMLDFKPIFETHFFSNHHVQAQQAEALLEAQRPGQECVTFSSFAALVTAVADELASKDTPMVCVSSSATTRQMLRSLNVFLQASARLPVVLDPGAIDLQPRAQGRPADVLLLAPGGARAELLDFTGVHPMLGSAGVFVSSNADWCEKVRWARSSYGRRGAAQVSIGANGRFSEFQAMLIQQALQQG